MNEWVLHLSEDDLKELLFYVRLINKNYARMTDRTLAKKLIDGYLHPSTIFNPTNPAFSRAVSRKLSDSLVLKLANSGDRNLFIHLLTRNRLPVIDRMYLEGKFYNIPGYVRVILKGQRWPELEAKILNFDGWLTTTVLEYLSVVGLKTWPEYEAEIIKRRTGNGNFNLEWAIKYAAVHKKEGWPELKMLLRRPTESYQYCRSFGRDYGLEENILNNEELAVQYSKIIGRWPELEKRYKYVYTDRCWNIKGSQSNHQFGYWSNLHRKMLLPPESLVFRV